MGATPKAVSDVTVHSEGSPSEYQDTPPFNFDLKLFESATPRVRKTRRARREVRRAYQSQDVQSLSREELIELQRGDDTLATIRENLKPSTEAERGDFYEEDGLLYRRWIPQGHGEEMEVRQLVLPQQCRSTVLTLAHSIPLAGHLGRKKTADRVLQRFYWPTLFHDVAEKCHTCPECQKTASRPQITAPLIPLPIVDASF